MIELNAYSPYKKGLFRQEGKTFVVAHRGYQACNPENTLLAFTAATKIGCDALECDVQITSDGVPVVFHDATMDALTTGTGTIAANTLSYVRGRYYDGATAGHLTASLKIPTFDSFVAHAKKTNTPITPEIKAYRTQADIQLIVDKVVEYGMEDMCILNSFDMTDLEYVRNYHPSIAVAYLGNSSVQATYEPAIDQIAALGNAYITWSKVALLNSPAIVSYAASKGVGITAWALTDYNDIEDLHNIGVWNIVSDTPIGNL